jgi:hypothetical protein
MRATLALRATLTRADRQIEQVAGEQRPRAGAGVRGLSGARYRYAQTALTNRLLKLLLDYPTHPNHQWPWRVAARFQPQKRRNAEHPGAEAVQRGCVLGHPWPISSAGGVRSPRGSLRPGARWHGPSQPWTRRRGRRAPSPRRPLWLWPRRQPCISAASRPRPSPRCPPCRLARGSAVRRRLAEGRRWWVRPLGMGPRRRGRAIGPPQRAPGSSRDVDGSAARRPRRWTGDGHRGGQSG